MVAVGFCGAFTTISAFSLETVALVHDGHWAHAALYAAGTVALGVLALLAGMALAGAAFRARA